MSRSDDRKGARRASFSVVEGGRGDAHGGPSQSRADREVAAATRGYPLDDLMLMLLDLLTCRSASDEPAANAAIERCEIDEIIDRLVEEGSVTRDPGALRLRLTEQGRGDAEFLLKAYRGFEALLDKAAALGPMPDAPVTRQGDPVRAFVFHVELDLGGLHPCWREIIAPAFLSFDVFHMAIQSAFLFAGYHLYDFELRTRGELARISMPENIDEDVFFPLSSVSRTYDSSHIHLDDVFPKTRTARYAYDYGDGWEFKIRLVETVDAYEGPWPCCVRGAGDAPPEDVGGIGGFEGFLRAISDPSHPDHEDLCAWGRMQLWEPFSLEAVNHRIAIWPTLEFEALWNEAHGEL